MGMGAVFAGIIRAPITSVLIIFEMTGSSGLLLPLMISNMTAFALARHFRPTLIYEALLHQDKVYRPHRGRVSHALEQLRVGSAMTTKPVTIIAAISAAEFQQFRSNDRDRFSLCNLCVVCVSVVSYCCELVNHRTEVAQRNLKAGS